MLGARCSVLGARRSSVRDRRTASPRPRPAAARTGPWPRESARPGLDRAAVCVRKARSRTSATGASARISAGRATSRSGGPSSALRRSMSTGPRRPSITLSRCGIRAAGSADNQRRDGRAGGGAVRGGCDGAGAPAHADPAAAQRGRQGGASTRSITRSAWPANTLGTGRPRSPTYPMTAASTAASPPARWRRSTRSEPRAKTPASRPHAIGAESSIRPPAARVPPREQARRRADRGRSGSYAVTLNAARRYR